MSRKKTKTQIPKLVIDDKDTNDPHGSVLLLIVISRKLDQLYAWPQRLIPMSQFRDNF